MASPREILNEFRESRSAFAKADPERMQGWLGLRKAAFAGGVLDAKTKELIAACIGLSIRCKYCIVAHVYQALEAGATREELIEAAYTATGMGGGPTLSYAATLFFDSINEFAPDFGK
jgi:AhpD family alkylhydroperoxidase